MKPDADSPLEKPIAESKVAESKVAASKISESRIFDPHVRLASLPSRLLGAIIDGFITGAVGAPVTYIVYSAIHDDFWGQVPKVGLADSLLGGVITLATFLLIQGYPLATRGQTIGKMIVGTRIVSDKTNQILPFGPLLFKRYIIIWVIGSLGCIGSIIGLINILLIFRDNRKCLHDDFAGTKVIVAN